MKVQDSVVGAANFDLFFNRNMAEAYIRFRSQSGFEVHELDGQLACYYILLELQEIKYSFTDKSELIDEYWSILEGAFAGYASLLPDHVLTTSSDIHSMIELLSNVIAKLKQKGQFIPVNELQAIPTSDSHFLRCMRRPFETIELVKLYTGMVAVLNGTWSETKQLKNLG